jgi:hypothetical protein
MPHAREEQRSGKQHEAHMLPLGTGNHHDPDPHCEHHQCRAKVRLFEYEDQWQPDYAERFANGAPLGDAVPPAVYKDRQGDGYGELRKLGRLKLHRADGNPAHCAMRRVAEVTDDDDGEKEQVYAVQPS